MKTNKTGGMPVILSLIIIALGAIGYVRHFGSGDYAVAAKYEKPKGDTIAVAIEMSPLTYTLRNDTAEGFDYNMLSEIAAEHGVAVRFYPFSQLEPAFRDLYDRRYDILIASLTSTNSIKNFFALTEPVYLDRQVLVQRADTIGGRGPVTSQEQLMHDTVWVAEGSPFATRLRNMCKELGDTIFVMSSPRYSSEHLAILTALGEVRHAVVNEAVARDIAADYPELDINTPISFNNFQCWAVAPGDSVLLDSLNVWIKEFKQTRQYRRLADKYL